MEVEAERHLETLFQWNLLNFWEDVQISLAVLSVIQLTENILEMFMNGLFKPVMQE